MTHNNAEHSILTDFPNSSPTVSFSDNAASLHFETQHEGSLQVPIPCAVLIVVFITMLIIALIALSGESSLPTSSLKAS